MKIRTALLVAALTLPTLTHSQEAATTHRIESEHGTLIAEKVASGLDTVAAIQLLPDGRALLADRPTGIISLVDFDTGESRSIEGLPTMVVVGDAGIHDIELHPDYADNGWVYVSYSEGEEHYSTLVLDRMKIDGTTVAERERVFKADAYSEGEYHFGGRIQFHDGYLFMSIGDRQHDDRGQERDNHAGTIVRLHDDGRVPDDNPFVNPPEDERDKPLPEIWSWGHRNPQGLMVHPDTGQLWSNEHGPRGGDELNLIKRGANYGWPEISYGFQYDGGPIGKGIVRAEGMEQPLWVYVPSIAPSDLVVYQGEAFPAWQGSFLIGSLAMSHMNRLVLRDGVVVAEERIGGAFMTRIRSIAVDPAGLVYVGNGNGEIWRLRPE